MDGINEIVLRSIVGVLVFSVSLSLHSFIRVSAFERGERLRENRFAASPRQIGFIDQRRAHRLAPAESIERHRREEKQITHTHSGRLRPLAPSCFD